MTPIKIGFIKRTIMELTDTWVKQRKLLSVKNNIKFDEENDSRVVCPGLDGIKGGDNHNKSHFTEQLQGTRH